MPSRAPLIGRVHLASAAPRAEILALLQGRTLPRLSLIEDFVGPAGYTFEGEVGSTGMRVRPLIRGRGFLRALAPWIKGEFVERTPGGAEFIGRIRPDADAVLPLVWLGAIAIAVGAVTQEVWVVVLAGILGVAGAVAVYVLIARRAYRRLNEILLGR